MDSETLPCLRAWPRLAAHADRDPATSPQLLRPDGSVVRFGDVVLKHAPDAFPRVVRAHRQASRILKDDIVNRAARFMGFDEPEEVVMVAHVPGRSVAEEARAGRDPLELCALVGRWLAAFHGARETDVARFSTKTPLATAPKRAVFLPEAYLAARERLEAMAQQIDGENLPRAVLHGDLNGSNLILRDEIVTGIDFANLHLHPAMRDCGQILAALHLRAKTPPRTVLPKAWRTAFESGYGATGPQLEFFVLQRLMLHWAQVPEITFHLSDAKRAMADALEAIFS